MRTIANRNEILGLSPVTADMPVYVTKDDAREARRAEASLYGGLISGQGMAASMQVSWRYASVKTDRTDRTCRVQRTRSSMHDAIACSGDARCQIEIDNPCPISC